VVVLCTARRRAPAVPPHPENILEELDSAREWYADFEAQKLFYRPNATGPPPSVVTVPHLATILSIEGGRPQQQPVVGVKLQGAREQLKTQPPAAAFC
jgi:hypothetical protein